MEATMKRVGHPAVIAQWMDTIVALHAVAPIEASQYLTEWIQTDKLSTTESTTRMLCSLVVRLPMPTLDACTPPTVSEIIPMYLAFTLHGASLEKPPDEHDAVCARMITYIMDGFASDDPAVLRDLKTNLSVAAMEQLFRSPAAPGLVGLRRFAARLQTIGIMDIYFPTDAHAELLMHCVEDLGTEMRTELLSPIITGEDFDRWWPDELVAHSICSGVESGVLDYVFETFVDIWYDRAPEYVASHADMVACIVSGLYRDDDRIESTLIFTTLADLFRWQVPSAVAHRIFTAMDVMAQSLVFP
jgi:hypothetical protein